MTWEEIKQWIRDATPWWLSWLLEPLLTFIDAIVDAWRAVKNNLWDAFWGWLQGRITDWWSWLSDRFTNFHNWLSERYHGFLAWLSDRLHHWWNWLSGRINEWWVWLQVKAAEFGIWLNDRLNYWSTWLSDKLNYWSTWLSDRLNAWGSWLLDKLYAFLGWLSDRWHDFWAWVGDRLGDFWAWLSDRWHDFTAWLSDRLSDWGAWLEDRHQELIEFLYGEEGVVTGAIEELKEWIGDLLDKLIREVILHLMDWMGFVAFPIEDLDKETDFFSPFTDYLEAVAYEWRELKEDWVKDAMAMMEEFAAELRGEEEMIPKRPSQIFWENWWLLPDDVRELIEMPPIKG